MRPVAIPITTLAQRCRARAQVFRHDNVNATVEIAQIEGGIGHRFPRQSASAHRNLYPTQRKPAKSFVEPRITR